MMNGGSGHRVEYMPMVMYCLMMIEMMKKSRLRWVGHVERNDDNDWVKRCITWEVEGIRQRGRPKKTWWDCVKNDMESMAFHFANFFSEIVPAIFYTFPLRLKMSYTNQHVQVVLEWFDILVPACPRCPGMV